MLDFNLLYPNIFSYENCDDDACKDRAIEEEVLSITCKRTYN